jgi:hypothetical protein
MTHPLALLAIMMANTSWISLLLPNETFLLLITSALPMAFDYLKLSFFLTSFGHGKIVFYEFIKTLGWNMPLPLPHSLFKLFDLRFTRCNPMPYWLTLLPCYIAAAG